PRQSDQRKNEITIVNGTDSVSACVLVLILRERMHADLSVWVNVFWYDFHNSISESKLVLVCQCSMSKAQKTEGKPVHS
ncbi:hypothetical protein DKP78_25325, partial [Enterococcus faecium]